MIPKKIHYFWVGGNPKPESVLFCIETWKKHCPDYEIIEWNETNYDFSKNQYMRQAYEARKWGFVPDYARLDVVYRYGGVYFDTDVELIKNIDSLLNNKAFFGFERTEEAKRIFVNTGEGFGAEAFHPVVEGLMKLYENERFVNPDGSLNLTPQPNYTTKYFQTIGLKRENIDQNLNGAMIYASDVLCPKAYCASRIHLTERTVSIHHYDASWLDKNLKKKHDRSILIHRFFGDGLGENLDKFINDTEYLISAVKKRIRIK